MAEHAIRIGGLMRCCIETLNDRARTGEPHEGEKIECKYAPRHSAMIYRDGAWEWLKEDERNGPNSSCSEMHTSTAPVCSVCLGDGAGKYGNFCYACYGTGWRLTCKEM